MYLSWKSENNIKKECLYGKKDITQSYEIADGIIERGNFIDNIINDPNSAYYNKINKEVIAKFVFQTDTLLLGGDYNG